MTTSSAPHFNRQNMLAGIETAGDWDIVVIGGGATGLGTALDAASRGYRTLLLEQHDFAKATSSRSTKLVHGGVRYLAQGNIRLVYGALHEREILLRNAPHVATHHSFIVPCYSLWEKAKYGIGLKLYDLLAGSKRFGSSKLLDAGALKALLPNIAPRGLRGGVQYTDGQFDDARLAINLAQTAAAKGATLLNYCCVDGLLKEDGRITGVRATDVETGHTYAITAKVVVNATGVFVDEVLQMDTPGNRPVVRPSQGVHLVVHRRFLPGNDALVVPKTSDGRVLFAVPWHGHTLIGTTDTPVASHSLEPIALESEIAFILDSIALYLAHPPRRADVLSIFAGLRPLAAADGSQATREISRDHKLMVSPSGLVTITGGKWTTYRKMAEDTVTAAAARGGLPPRPCLTRNIPVHGAAPGVRPGSVYGTDQQGIDALTRVDPSLARPLAEGFTYTAAHVIWAVRHEMARTVEDVLARRTRLLFLDAGAALAAAPQVAELMMNELHLTIDWKNRQLQDFGVLAQHYRLSS